MKPGLSITLLIPLLALDFAGCVSAPSLPDSSASHPANPQAEGSPEAPLRPMLMADSQGLVLPVSTNQTEMHHGQHQHTPSGKSAQQPAELRHDHEHGKETSVQGAVYTCPHHPEVKQSRPGECPKCGMKLEAKK
jgi:hypothetical protein